MKYKNYIINTFRHFKKVCTHKHWVFYYCCKVGIPFQGLVHDLSKFSPTEFWESVKYYQGTSSPIDACKKEEWMVHIWGGAWNHDANPSIEKDLGIKKGYYYFDTEEEKNKFIQLIRQDKYEKQGLATECKYGIMTHKRTIFVATLKYKDKTFVIHYDLGYEYPKDSAIFYFTEGNFGCDCNRSLAIKWEYGEDAIPELPCGDEIEMTDYHVEYQD